MRKEALFHSLEVACDKWMHRQTVWSSPASDSTKCGERPMGVVKFFNYRAQSFCSSTTVSGSGAVTCIPTGFSLAHSSMVLTGNRTADKYMLFQEGMLWNWRDCVLLNYLAFPKLDIRVRLCDDLYVFDRSHFNKTWQQVLKFYRWSSAMLYSEVFFLSLGNTQYNNRLPL